MAALATAVINSDACFGLFGGYAAWDGVEPQPTPDRDESEFGEAWHSALSSPEGTARPYDGFGGV